MTKTVLQRIQTLADAPPLIIYAKLATILRKLASADDPVDKAMTITRLFKDLNQVDQERVLGLFESMPANATLPSTTP